MSVKNEKVLTVLTHVDLFAGIGGFPLAATWAGFRPVLMCEIKEYNQDVLRKHFPGVPIHPDIRSLDAEKIREYIGNEAVTLISGGFPCQPFSDAGKRRGTADDRHLWPEMLRVIRIVLPRWVLAENVPGLLSTEEGMVFESLCTDLESSGYTLFPLLIPAAGAGSPHVRKRILLVAHSDYIGDDFRKQPEKVLEQKGREGLCGSGVCPRNGFGERWNTEPSVDRVAYGVPRRVDRIEGLGNAVAPPAMYPVLRTIAKIEEKSILKNTSG